MLQTNLNKNDTYLNTKYSFLFIFLITFTQFIQFIFDSLALEFPIYFLSGYLFCHCIGAYLFINNDFIKKNLVRKNIFTLLFIIYLSILLLATSDLRNFIGLMLYKDGIINWFLIGFEMNLVSKILISNNYSFKRLNKIFYSYLYILLISYLIYAIFFYISYKCCDPLYQRMSVNSYISFIILFIIFKIKNSNSLFDQNYIVYPFSLILSFIDNKARSLAIILYWLNFFIGNNLINSIKKLKKFLKYLFISFLSLLCFICLCELINLIINYAFSIENLFRDSPFSQFTKSARFKSVINLNFNNFNPIASRLYIIKEFPKQFMYSPFFGGWYPEIKVGSGSGLYQHSFILSLLTHTGLFGTTIFLLSFFELFRKRFIFCLGHLDNLNSQLFIQLIGMFMISNIHFFLVFPPFWFLFGLVSPGYINLKNGFKS